MISPEVFSQGLSVLMETFEKKLSERLTSIYYGVLKNLTRHQWEQAVERAVSECKHFPRPAELIELAGAGKKSTHDFAVQAWAVLLKTMARTGRYRSVDFGPAVNAAVRSCGGWIALCEMPTAELKWKRKEFIELVESYQRTSHIGALAEPLRGLIDEHNGGVLGMKLTVPTRIRITEGETETALVKRDEGKVTR